MANNMKVAGLDELMANLKNLSRATQKGVMTRALKKSAPPMINSAKSKIRNRTGDLGKSIIVSDKQSSGEAQTTRKRGSRDQATVYVGPQYASKSNPGGVNYGHLVEFGTKPHINGGKFAGTKHPGATPKPFLRPAFAETKDEVMQKLGENMAKEIEASIKRQRKKG